MKPSPETGNSGSGSPDLSRSEQRRLEFQQKIIDAAIDLFAKNGVNETPVTEIIRQAGIAHKTFFNHFASKHHLMVAIARQYSLFSDAIFEEEIKKDLPPADKLENCFMLIASSLSQMDDANKTVIKHVMMGALQGPKEASIFQQEKITNYVAQILREAEYSGQLQDSLDKSIYAEQIAGLFVASMMVWSCQENYQLVEHMSRTMAFIKHAVFKL